MGIYPLILDKAERRHSDVTVDDGLGETSQNHPISCGCKTLNGCVWTCMMFTPMCLPAWIRFWWNLIISWQRRVYWIKLENFGFCGDVIYRLVCSPVNYRVTSSILIHEMLIFGSQMIPGPLTKQMTGWWWLEHGFYDFPFSWECHHPNWQTHIFQRGRYTTNQDLIDGDWNINNTDLEGIGSYKQPIATITIWVCSENGNRF